MLCNYSMISPQSVYGYLCQMRRSALIMIKLCKCMHIALTPQDPSSICWHFHKSILGSAIHTYCIFSDGLHLSRTYHWGYHGNFSHKSKILPSEDQALLQSRCALTGKNTTVGHFLHRLTVTVRNKTTSSQPWRSSRESFFAFLRTKYAKEVYVYT